jgi:hypothetical protein
MTDIDEFLAGLPEETRSALEGLRRTIAKAAPEAVEAISYAFQHSSIAAGLSSPSVRASSIARSTSRARP